MIRTIRVLGAALGALVGLGIAAAGTGLFAGVSYAGFILAAWTIAWTVVGFALLPYLTIVPAGWLISHVQELSTAEFVAAVLGLFVGCCWGCCSACRSPRSRGRWGPGCRSASRCSSGSG